MRGEAFARFELVLTIPGGPIGPNGEADRGGSAGTSLQGSLGEGLKRGAEAMRGDGLKVAAFALKPYAELLELAEARLIFEVLYGKVGV